MNYTPANSPPNAIFVFGSNEAGRHGAGAARDARLNWGAIPGQGVGIQGRAYAIPTKDRELRRLSLPAIARYVADFLRFAVAMPATPFLVTRIGCGLSGYTDEDISPMFDGAPPNCTLPKGWGKPPVAAPHTP